MWTSLQFSAVCGKDQSRSVKQAEAVVYSSWSLARADRRDSGYTRRSVPFFFPLGSFIETSVSLCWVTNHWAVTVCGLVPGEAAPFLWVWSWNGWSSSKFCWEGRSAAKCRSSSSASDWVTSLSAGWWVRGWFGKMLTSMECCLVLWVAAGIRKEVIGREVGVNSLCKCQEAWGLIEWGEVCGGLHTEKNVIEN